METLRYPIKTKAYKEHNCSFCAGKIRTGETYMKSTHKDGGDIYDWKAHLHCANIAERLNMYDNADDGVTQEDFRETIHCVHDDLLINLIPKEELKKYRDIIQQLRAVNFKEKLNYVISYYAEIDKKN